MYFEIPSVDLMSTSVPEIELVIFLRIMFYFLNFNALIQMSMNITVF